MSLTQTKQQAAKLAALRARIATGGILNPETLARSYGLPVSTVSFEIEAHGGPYGKKG